MPISIAPLLTRQSPSPSYGHGWIMGKQGKRWHPAWQQTTLTQHRNAKIKESSWLLKLLPPLWK
ncbi:phage filamentation protein Fil family protein [Nissabacter sp. SGAir0207]|uniref:phage filamentation protein Fil family protein n=1 Tax=Nissabacter sp. SGAir0207 TaxID=2126321 RepID=UPI0010CCD0A3|nr:phage filamentation protein Fil family protein [Nissabacter sp. SGAir0207]QCR38024.1 DUF2724 domain-containing protein [Nissabacter sp. SGAir0207]